MPPSMHLTTTFPTAKKQNPPLPRSPLKQPVPAIRFAGGPSLETVDPNNLEQIQRLPVTTPIRAIAMKIAPKTSNPVVMQYLAQRFKQDFKTVDYPVNPVHEQTLLHIAVSTGRPKLVEVLLSEGANPLAENKKGEDALDWAESKMRQATSPTDRQDIQKMLLKRVKTFAKQPIAAADKTSTAASADSLTASTSGASSSWLSGWGLGGLFAQPSETPKKAPTQKTADSLPSDGQKPGSNVLPEPPTEPSQEKTAQKELDRLQKTQSLLQTQLAEARSNIKQLEQTAKKAVQDNKQIQQEKKQLEAELEQLRSEAARLENEASQRQTADNREIKRLSKKEESLKKRLEQKTEELQKAEQKLGEVLMAQDTQMKSLQASHAQQTAKLKQELQNAQKIALRPSPAESPTSSSSGSASAQSPQDRARTGKLYAKINGLQTELSKANERIHQLSEELMLAQKQYREWIARLLQEKDSLNFQLARTQWQRDESAFILPKVHQVNEQLVANINHQGRELQALRHTINQHQAALSAQQTQLAQQARQIQEQTELIQLQKVQKNTLSKTVKHLMALSTSHRSELQRQELDTYQRMLDLLAEKIQSASSEEPASGALAELEADLKTLIGYRRQQMESHTVLSTALASLSPEEPEDSSDADTPSAARRFPMRSRSFR